LAQARLQNDGCSSREEGQAVAARFSQSLLSLVMASMVCLIRTAATRLAIACLSQR